MALDFPSDPLDGQVYENYYYDEGSGAWRSLSSTTNPIPSTLRNVTLTTGASDEVPVKVKSYPGSQSANIQEWYNPADELIGSLDVNGKLSVKSIDLENDIPYSYNYIINGGFDIWQRGTNFNISNIYTADRWYAGHSATPTSRTVSRQETEGIIPGISDIKYYLRSVINTLGSGTNIRLQQAVENVETLAGKNVTFSFWARSSVAGSFNLNIQQRFGTGGSSIVSVYSEPEAYGTAWERHTITVNIPSVAGKTIGANSHILFEIYQDASDGSTFEITGVQLEEGPYATPFRRNSPNIQAELAACQRYYWQTNYEGFVTAGNAPIGMASASANNIARVVVNFPVSMRRPPNSVGFGSATGFTVFGTTNQTTTVIALNGSTVNAAFVTFTTAATMVAGQAYLVRHITVDDYLSFSAEL